MPRNFYEKLKKQFRNTQRVPFMLDKARKHLFPNWKKTFSRKLLHSAENPEESSMLAKRFVSGKIPRGFDLKKLKKLHSSEKTAVLKNKFGYSMLVHCKNQILGEKIFVLKNLTMLKIVKDPSSLLKIQSVPKYFKKIEIKTLWRLKFLNKMRTLTSLKLPKNMKGGPLGFLNIQSVANDRKTEEETL